MDRKNSHGEGDGDDAAERDSQAFVHDGKFSLDCRSFAIRVMFTSVSSMASLVTDWVIE